MKIEIDGLIVTLTKEDGRVIVWHGTEATIHEEDGKRYLNIFNSPEAGTFGIEIQPGDKVQVEA